MLKTLKICSIALTGIISYALIYWINKLYKNYFSNGLEDWIRFMYIKIYGAGILFSMLFILIFSIAYKRMKLMPVLAFIFLNACIYIMNVYLLSENIPFLPESILVNDFRLLIIPATGAFLFLFLLGKTSRVLFSPLEFMILTFIGAVPSIYEIFIYPAFSNTDRGQYIIPIWQVIIPIGIVLILLRKDHRPLSDLPPV
jgi:hypothetical protein